MKVHQLATLTFLSALLLSSARAAPNQTSIGPERAEHKINVSFNQPENFTDFRTANGGRNNGRNGLIAELKRFLRARGKLWLPEPYRLDIQFNDIDMAGRIVPLPIRRKVGGSSLGVFGSAPKQRVVQNPWPPRLNFEYRIYNEYGDLIREGNADISETSFLKLSSRLQQVRRDTLQYEKAILDTWLRSMAQN